VQLASGSAELAVSSEDTARGLVEIAGTIKDSKGLADRLTASYRATTAGGDWRIASLRGRADLLELAKNFPGVPSSLPEAVKLRSAFPEIAVTDFVYRPGGSATFESLRLLSAADITLTVQGQPLRVDRLSGQVGFDGKRWKLSPIEGAVFNGEVKVNGTYEDGMLKGAAVTGANLQVDQLRPWLAKSQATLAEGVLAFQYRGTVGTKLTETTGEGTLRLEKAPIVQVPLLDQTYALFSALSSPVERKGSGRMDTSFSAANGIVTISEFTAWSDAARVTAHGTIDLRQRKVEGKARGNIRGILGLATGPLSRALEMQVSGPLDDVRVRPAGFSGIVGGIFKGTAEILPNTVKRSTGAVRDGVTLPLRILNFSRD